MLARHLCRLSREDRARRFMGGLSDEAVESHCRKINWLRTVVIGYFDGGVLRAAAELQLADGDFPILCETALTVETRWQQHGIATELLRRIVVIARNRWARGVRLICLPDNGGMQHVAEKFGARFHFEGGESMADIATPAPTLGSLWEEMLDDGHGWIDAWMGNGSITALAWHPSEPRS